MKPTVLIVGADKGGVGKTTITRTVLDYLASKNTLARAFDTEFPRGTLKRFHPDVTTVVDITSVSDQMKIVDTLSTSEVKISLVDIRAGLLSYTLKSLTDIGFFDAVNAGEFNFLLFHILGPSIASLDEINEVMPYTNGKNYFAVKNFVNETSFFEWDPAIYESYFKKARGALDVTIPKLNEMAFEQVELAGVPFSTFVKNKNAQGHTAKYSLVLRGYVRTWLNQIFDEYDRVSLHERLTDRAPTSRPGR